MVDSKRYNPSNKRFQEHTKHFIEGTTLKGHLNDEKKKKDKYKTTGQLIRVVRAKIYSDGWETKVDGKKINCNYGDNIVYLPPHTVTDLYYIPKKKCEVEISIDEKSKIHTITRIKDPNKQPISMTNDGITLEGKDGALLKVENNSVEATADGEATLRITTDKVEVSGDNLSVQNDVKIDTTEDEDLPDEISVKQMYKEIQILKGQINDSDSDSDAGDE